MKICLITALYEPHILGGAEVYVQKIANRLAEKHDVVIITTEPYSGVRSFIPQVQIMANGIKIYRFYPMNLYYGFFQNKSMLLKPAWHMIDLWNPHVYSTIKKILRDENPDLVHTHNLEIMSTSALSAIKSVKIHHIHTLHDYILLNRWNNLLRNGDIISKFNFFDKCYMNLMKHLSSSVDVVVSPSQFVLDMHVNNGFFQKSNCMKLPHGIELNNINADKDYDEIDILYTGQLAKHKGVHVLIKAFKEIKGSNLRLHITGKGPYTDELKKLADGDERITFYGFVSDEKLTELYEMANISVVPSVWYEVFGLIIQQSFNAGTLVIGSKIGGIPELIKDGYNGYLFEAGNVDELRNVLVDIIHDEIKMKELSNNARKSVEQYAMGEHITKLERIYKNLIKC